MDSSLLTAAHLGKIVASLDAIQLIVLARRRDYLSSQTRLGPDILSGVDCLLARIDPLEKTFGSSGRRWRRGTKTVLRKANPIILFSTIAIS
jgi:hypothetical protein